MDVLATTNTPDKFRTGLNPRSTSRWPESGQMLVKRRRLWVSNKRASGQLILLTGDWNNAISIYPSQINF